MALVIKGSAQTAVNLHKMILVPANAIQLDSLLNLINKQAGVKFSINTRKFPAGKYIRIKANKQTIGGLLQEIKANTGVYYAILGDHIILLDNPPPAKRKATNVVNTTHTVLAPHLPAAPSVSQKQPVPPNKNSSIKHIPPDTNPHISNQRPPAGNATTPLPAVTAADAGANKNFSSDTIKTTVPIPASKDSVKAQSPVGKKPAATINQVASRASSPTKERSIAGNMLIKAGLGADDVFYFNPTIQAGIKYVYALASFSSNFKISGFRYGLGGAIELNDQWNLQLQLTTGNLSSTFDTAGQKWEFKTQLHRAACIAEARIGNRISVQFGPVFNLMKLTFYQAGIKMAPGLPDYQIDKKFNLIKPIYTLSDNFSMNRAQSTKMWIGFQLGLFVDLNFLKQE
ncbi:hypothetical protein A3860_19035 [Niastella vici]|uniref:Uncharacterized protein n=2 Tax=Niastella vici TaxID=1703345 RepID=A0A1V9G2K2_9BACT|nr:hypothetical protein A3860_19035 [Niastella vici]